MTSGRRDAISVDQIRPDQRAHQPNPLFDKINGRAVQLQLVAAATIPTQVEGCAVADQRTDLVYS